MLIKFRNERSSYEILITVSILDLSCEIKMLWSKNKNIAYAHMVVFVRIHTCNSAPRILHQTAVEISVWFVHSGKRPYVFNVCGKSLSHLSTFNSHNLIHTGEVFFIDLTGIEFALRYFMVIIHCFGISALLLTELKRQISLPYGNFAYC